MQKNEIFNPKNLTRLALVAAMYVALTLAVPALSYGAIQCRFSEILVLLCFYRRDYSAALIVGCFIANLFSPLGWYDLVFGVAATAIAVLPMHSLGNVFLAALLPVVSNGILVGIELNLIGEPLWFSMGTVALGELAVMALGAVVFKTVFERNSALMRLIGAAKRSGQKTAV